MEVVYQLIDPVLHDGYLVLVALAAFVRISFGALKVFAPRGIKEYYGRGQDVIVVFHGIYDGW